MVVGIYFIFVIIILIYYNFRQILQMFTNFFFIYIIMLFWTCGVWNTWHIEKSCYSFQVDKSISNINNCITIIMITNISDEEYSFVTVFLHILHLKINLEKTILEFIYKLKKIISGRNCGLLFEKKSCIASTTYAYLMNSKTFRERRYNYYNN